LPLQTLPVDLSRYMGRWYVTANIPYFAASRAQWALRTDGRIDRGSSPCPKQSFDLRVIPVFVVVDAITGQRRANGFRYGKVARLL